MDVYACTAAVPPAEQTGICRETSAADEKEADLDEDDRELLAQLDDDDPLSEALRASAAARRAHASAGYFSTDRPARGEAADPGGGEVIQLRDNPRDVSHERFVLHPPLPGY